MDLFRFLQILPELLAAFRLEDLQTCCIFDCNFQVAAVGGKVDLVVDALEKSAADKTLDKNLKT